MRYPLIWSIWAYFLVVSPTFVVAQVKSIWSDEIGGVKTSTPEISSGGIDWNEVERILESKPPVSRRTQWLVFRTDWCEPCRKAEQDYVDWLSASGWKIGETADSHVLTIDGEARPDLVRQYGISGYPTFILVQDGQPVLRYNRYPGRKILTEQYSKYHISPNPPLTSLGSVKVGTIPGNSIREALKNFSRSGNNVTTRFDGNVIVLPEKLTTKIEPISDGIRITFEPSIAVGNGYLTVKVSQASVDSKQIRAKTDGMLTPDLVLDLIP